MILTLQAMTKIIYTPELQNLTLPSYMTHILQTENYSNLKQLTHTTSKNLFLQ